VSSNIPPHGEPEILDSSGGQPESAPKRGNGRRTALIVGDILGGVAVVGGAAWAATWYFSSGPDAAEVLPDSTLGYAEINLDPSGDQKIEALNTLNKFPGFKDKLGLNATDDIRKSLFEEIQKDGTCPDVDYAKDIEPWLGDRMAVAAVDEGEDHPTPVVVVQITDEGKAKDGLDKLLSCDNADSGADPSGSGDGGYAIDGGWAVIAETADLADQIVKDAGEGALADDKDYQHWTDAAGADGIMTLYAAPEAGAELAKLVQGDLAGMGSAGSAASMMPGNSLGDDQFAQLEDFKGGAVKVRFNDGAVEAEFAGELAQTDLARALTGDSGDEVVATLPDDTALALGGSLKPGWFTAVMDQVASTTGDGKSADDLISEAETQTGLDLPDDAETLTGDGFAIAVGSGVDIEGLINSGDASKLGVGVKVKGDPEAIETVLDKVRPQTGDPSLLQSKRSGDYLSFGPDQDWLDKLSDNGHLGDNDTYRDVLPDADRASSVLYLNVDVGDDWLVKALQDAGVSEDIIDNVRPFSALGISSWVDGAETHGKLKLTTN
jgi:hypothetical protein